MKLYLTTLFVLVSCAQTAMRPAEPVQEQAIVSPTPEPESVVNEPPVASGKECTFTRKPTKKRKLKFGDGRSGMLWKPSSDTQAGGVLLLPGWYGRATNVSICCNKGKGTKDRCTSLRSAGGANPDPEGCRDHWRSSQSGNTLFRRFGSICTAVVDDQAVLIKNIRRRQD